MRAAQRGSDEDSSALGRCLSELAWFLSESGREEAALPIASRSVEMWRRLDDTRGLAFALVGQGHVERRLGENRASRQHYEEALAHAREINDQSTYAGVLIELAHLEYQTGHPERRVELEQAALTIFDNLGYDYGTVTLRHNMASSLRLLGRLHEADLIMREVIPQMLEVGRAGPWLAEDYAALLADLGSHEAVASLIGAADAFRERSGVPRDRDQEAEYREAFANARKALPPDIWNHEYRKGHAMTVEDAVIQAQRTQDTPT
jgi:tetratricopeptide (TPR) repeat protein